MAAGVTRCIKMVKCEFEMVNGFTIPTFQFSISPTGEVAEGADEEEDAEGGEDGDGDVAAGGDVDDGGGDAAGEGGVGAEGILFFVRVWHGGKW